jgi:hypothetical protein
MSRLGSSRRCGLGWISDGRADHAGKQSQEEGPAAKASGDGGGGLCPWRLLTGTEARRRNPFLLLTYRPGRCEGGSGCGFRRTQGFGGALGTTSPPSPNTSQSFPSVSKPPGHTSAGGGSGTAIAAGGPPRGSWTVASARLMLLAMIITEVAPKIARGPSMEYLLGASSQAAAYPRQVA